MQPLVAGDPRRVGGFTVVGRLGAGGMGIVYLATSPTGQRVAVKQVHAHVSDDPGFRARFRQEVAAAAKVSGVHTAEVLAADPDADPPWMATEFVDGPDLQILVDERGPLPDAQVLELAAGVADALVNIHAAGVVHRDLKPSNVVITGEGPRVIDFGLARAAEATALTGTGYAVGTAGYMSPEQVDGETVGASSDVFSLGAMLCYAATGRLAFGEHPPMVLLYRVVHDEPDLSGIADAALRDIVQRCLIKDPVVRPTPERILNRARALLARRGSGEGASWSALAERPRLTSRSQALDSRDVETTPRTPPPPARAGLSRRTVLAGAGLAGLAGAGGIALARSRRAGSPPTSEPGPSARVVPDDMDLRLENVLPDLLTTQALAFTALGRLVAGGSLGTVDVVDVTTPGKPAVRQLSAGGSAVLRIAAGASELVAAATVDGVVRVWNGGDGTLLHRFRVPSTADVSGGIGFDGAGRRLLAGGVVWDLATNKPALTVRGGPAALLRSGRRVLRGAGDAVEVLDASGAVTARIPTSVPGAVTVVAVANDELTAVAGTDQGRLTVCRLATGKAEPCVGYRSGVIRAVEMSGDGKVAVTAGTNGSLGLWDLQQPSCMRLKDQVVVALAMDGTRVATAASATQLWQLARPRRG